MTSIVRREALKWMAAGASLSLLGGCASGRSMAGSAASLDLVYYADTLDARQPGLPVVPRTRLGAASRIGQAPWLTGSSARSMFAQSGTFAALLDADVPPAETGGYAVLGALIEGLRNQAGAERCLVLENGQCWNGSGLAMLTQGASGLQGSALLGADVRVSSDERVLWPEQASGLYRQWGRPVLGAGLNVAGVQPMARFQRSGVKIAVAGVIDPYASDSSATLAQWFDSLQPVLDEARREADLLILLADVGSGPARWLAERLPQVDIVLAARGQDLWPQAIEVAQLSGRKVPLLLAGSRACGAFHLHAERAGSAWHFQARFHPAYASQLDAQGQQLQARLAQTLHEQRRAHADWLDQPLAKAPEALWRRDVRGGSWDRLIYQALAESYEGGVLLPGLRYDVPLRRGQTITREHLICLSGSHPAAVREVAAQGLSQVLENAAEQLFGDPVILDNSQDLPRLFGQRWQVDYSPGGKRVQAAELPPRLRTFTLGRQNTGQALWQWLEAYLRERPSDWQLPNVQLPALRYVQGHPGWHPAREQA